MTPQRTRLPVSDEPVSLDAPAIDAALPWRGLPRCVLHEIAVGGAPGEAEAATGFASVLLARLAEAGHPAGLLWVLPANTVTRAAPGDVDLAQFGLDRSALTVRRTESACDALSAIETGLRDARNAAVLAEADGIGLNASRRLHRAAGESHVTGLLFRRAGALDPAALPPSAAMTRWRIRPAPDAHASLVPSGATRWRLDLLRCHGAAPGIWTVDYDHATRRFALAPALSSRPADPNIPSLTFPEGVRPRNAPAPDTLTSVSGLAG